jgi:hypothetical protein
MHPPPELTRAQIKQAMLLYHFSSSDYLKKMQDALNDVISYVGYLLDLAKAQDRDRHLVSEQWGVRETSENWAINAWPFLKNFQISTSRQLAERNVRKFNITGSNQFYRGISEYSMGWALTEEQEIFRSKLNEVARYARNIDNTLDKYSTSSRWNDFNITLAWERLNIDFSSVPNFKIRPDIIVETGQIPVKAGVYISSSDPHATLQFSWHDGSYGKLLLGRTFNSLGLNALTQVGRDDLWINKEKMLSFMLANRKDPLLKDDSFFSESPSIETATELIARNAFEEIDSKWLYVELINGE